MTDITVSSGPEGPHNVHQLKVSIGGKAIPAKHLRAVTLDVDTPSSVATLTIWTDDGEEKVTASRLAEQFELKLTTRKESK
jgi:hypothetical protein